MTTASMMALLFMLILICGPPALMMGGGGVEAAGSSNTSSSRKSRAASSSLLDRTRISSQTTNVLRGGANPKATRSQKEGSKSSSSSTSATKKVAKKRKRKKSSGGGVKTTQTAAAIQQQESAQKVSQVLKEKDAAQALGDAIRDRGEQLLRNDAAGPAAAQEQYSRQQSLRESVQSVGWALGASDYQVREMQQPLAAADDAGGVQVAPASVVVHYFLKSHGGAHALQCVCSLLAAVAGTGAVMLPLSNKLQLALLKRCLLFAMIKHVAGLLAASYLAAQGISVAGFRQAVAWMQELATDPVAQYTFYAATILFWLPSSGKLPKVQKAAASATSNQQSMSEITEILEAVGVAPAWWQAYRIVPLLLVGPVLLRELVSTALVVSDVLVLWACSSSDSTSSSVKIIQKLLKMAQATVNAYMSLLVTPKVWRSANAAERQAILAKLVSKVSLAFELAVGVLLAVDAGLGLTALLFGTTASSAKAPSLGQLVKRLVCTHLYLQFLWTRRRKIHRLATTVRGGASQVPLYVLSVVLDPRASMGLTPPSPGEKVAKSGSVRRNDLNWKDYVRLAVGLDE